MQMTRLFELAAAYPHIDEEKKGISEPPLPRLFKVCHTRARSIEAVVYTPVICLILQGRKSTWIGDQSVDLGPGDALLVSHDLPVSSQVTEASPDKPYVALILQLDLGIIRSLYEQVGETARVTQGARSLSTSTADATWVDPLSRYLKLHDKPLEAEVLGPLILREIHFRVLMSPLGGMLRNLLSVDSHASRVARAIGQIRKNFQSPLAVSDLARTAGMSQSAFHSHFKTVTGTTPLQYQKDLRMIEARRLMAEGRLSVAAAGYEVGYESATQFSREYARKFGVPPSRDSAVAQFA